MSATGNRRNSAARHRVTGRRTGVQTRNAAVPMIDLRPGIEQTAPAWRANLRRLFADSQFISGAQSACFEREFAASQGARFALGVGSGTAALQLSLRAAGVAAGQEVIVPALTSPFTALAILEAGGVPRFADVHPDTLLLDAAHARVCLNANTAAIVPVHLYGNICDLGELRALAEETG